MRTPEGEEAVGSFTGDGPIDAIFRAINAATGRDARLREFRVDAVTGGLTPHGQPKPLPHRAVNVCTDPAGTVTVNAHNLPKSGLTIHRINRDGTLGSEVEQPAGLEFGPYPHQVRVAPSGRTVVDVDRGNKAEKGKPEDPGALR